MSKNIIILADGTGQRGGMLVDERRSNIYKIFRATRCGPDSSVDPSLQLAYYDPGLGTLPGGIDSVAGFVRSYMNLASQATGLGIQRNMIDCYAALLRLWRPGDRIFLFGFSRGAYTVRCLGGVLSLCGLPTRNADGTPLTYSNGNLRRIAKEAVKTVYGYTPSRPLTESNERQKELLEQRRLLAGKFRRKFESCSGDESNCVPHFIGVFDTVASLMNPAALAGVAALSLLILAALGALGSWLLLGNLLAWFLGLSGGVVVMVAAWLGLSRIRAARSLPGHPFWRTFHINPLRVQMYDKSLDERVSFARHAISIDEARRSFPRVKWGQPGVWKKSDPPWFEQTWFAGNHSDIGGSYPENESRLSDIALKWMVDAAVKAGMGCDASFMQPSPDAEGMQHDETKSGFFKWARKEARRPLPDAPLHESVLARLASPGVLQFDVIKPYRPENLRGHEKAKRFYE